MSILVDGYENELLDGLTGVTQLTTPAIVYLALFTADPTDTGSVVNELTSSGYARQSIAGVYSAATGTTGTVSNTSEINFAIATGDWDAVTHVGFMESDVETTDDMMSNIQLDASIVILNGQTFTFAVGSLTLVAQ